LFKTRGKHGGGLGCSIKASPGKSDEKDNPYSGHLCGSVSSGKAGDEYGLRVRNL
jgi:hypothetical protein